MHWTRGAIIAVAAVAGQAAIADVIVVRANGPSAARFPAGKTLPDGARIAMQRGDQIVLLDARGTRTLTGPGNFPATGGASAAAPTTLTALASTSTSRRARVGAVRGVPAVDAATMRPGIFLVDVAVAGRVCVADPTAVTLWRAGTRDAAATTLTASDGRSATVSWIAGQETSPWPASLPVAQDATYRIVPASGGAGVSVKFQTLATPPADLPQLASALIAHGCQGQVDVLVATTSTAATAKAGG